jgi:hypothetical protein
MYSGVFGLLALVLACGEAHDEAATTRHRTVDGGGTPSAAPLPTSCDAASAQDLAVASDDLNGYPPYALAQCSLVYLGSGGDLILRDLATKEEVTLAPASDNPRRPSASIDPGSSTPTLVVVWESTLAGASVVRVRYGERTSTVTGDFVMATEPRVREHFVAFTAWKGTTPQDDTDVWLFDASSGAARLVIGGSAQQRFADVSTTHVVATDFSEDPDGRFDGTNDLADIIVFEIASGAVTRRAAPNKQAFPMLSKGGTLAYLSWNAIHPEPKLQSYELKAGPLFGDPAADKTIADVSYVSSDPTRPAMAGETIEWVANPDGVTSLYRAPADGSASPLRVSGLDDLMLYAPAPSSGTKVSFTVLAAAAVSGTDHTPRLRAVSR